MMMMARRRCSSSCCWVVLLLWQSFILFATGFEIPSVQRRRRSLHKQQLGSASVFQLSSSWSTSSTQLWDIIHPDNNNDNEFSSLDPYSSETHDHICATLNLSDAQYQRLVQLSECVVDWNDRINLVSRKDCTVQTVWERHVLPCAAAKALDDRNNPLHATETRTVCDVGTGGGFPGLPLAICYPDLDFCLLDSVGKKLKAVQAMADQLGLSNVQTHHGRAEDYIASAGQTFDVVTGRSVSALDQFCAWMQHLLVASSPPRKSKNHGKGHDKDGGGGGGQLLYWIGGELPAHILNRASFDTPLSELLPQALESSDKRILQFSAAAVREIARESNVVVQRQGQSARRPKTTTTTTHKKRNKTSKGAWKNRRSSSDSDDEVAAPKQRGYENFKRYSSKSSSSSSSSSWRD